jgi:hypothetical protein
MSRYLRGGGFMMIEGNPWYLSRMVDHVRAALGGEGRLRQVPFSHPLYHSYYDFPAGFPGERRGGLDLSTLTDDPWFFPDLATLYESPYTAMWGVQWEGELVAIFSPQQILALRPPLSADQGDVTWSPATTWDDEVTKTP